MEKQEKQPFDFEAFKKKAAERIKKGDELLGKEGVLTPLLKEFLEATLEGEIESHLEESDEPNRKNGKSRKQLKTSVGTIDLATPRDRNGSFEPEIVAKRQKTLGVDLTGKSLRFTRAEPVTVISGIISARCTTWTFLQPQSAALPIRSCR